MAPSFRERLVWDAATGEVRDGAVRYMLIRPDALMTAFSALPEDACRAVLESFRKSIVTHGAKSAAKYQAQLTASDPSLLALVATTAPQLGWGIWRLTPEPDGFELQVDNSPFAQGFGPSARPVCTPILGMLEAVSGLMGTPMALTEVACAATGAACCRFQARRR